MRVRKKLVFTTGFTVLALACGGGSDQGASTSDAASDETSSGIDGGHDGAADGDAAHVDGDATSAEDGATCGAIAPDTTLATRKANALAVIAPTLVPDRPYTKGDRGDCLDFGTDAYALVAALELDRIHGSGGVTPAAAAPIAKHVADVELTTIGTTTPGRCTFAISGAPPPMQAALSLAYAMARYGGAWPSDVKESIRALVEDGAWGTPAVYYLANGAIDIPVAQMIVGESLGRASLLASAKTNFQSLLDHLVAHGGIEENAPLYSTEHYPPLAFLWQTTSDAKLKAQAEIALEYGLLMEAHLYLPGGSGDLSTPKSRDYSGGLGNGGGQSMLPAIRLVTNDPLSTIDMAKAYPFVIFSAATDYVLPEVIRSIFLDKGEGYDFWAFTDIQQGAARTPNAIYDLGIGGGQVNPSETIVLPGGAASTGVAYGWRDVPIGAWSGTHVRTPANEWAIVYQYQPWVCPGGTAPSDTDDTASPIGGCGGGSSINADPDDFLSELYDYERMTYGWTSISIWDPTLEGKISGVVRNYKETRVHLPNWDSIGGAAKKAGNWRVGKIGEVYVAYLTLGTIAEESTRASTGSVGGTWTHMILSGVSGGVVELATTKQYATLDAYAADLSARTVKWVASPPSVELDAPDPATKTKHVVRLEYRPEKRFVDGVEQSISAALDHGLMQSPWVKWDATTERMTVSRACYPTVVYDWKAGSVTVTP